MVDRQRRYVAGHDRPDRLRQHPQRRELRRPAGEARLGHGRVRRYRLARRPSRPRPQGRADRPDDAAHQSHQDDQAGQAHGAQARRVRLRHRAEHGGLGPAEGLRPGRQRSGHALRRAAQRRRHARSEGDRPAHQDRPAADRYLHPQGPGDGGLGAAIRLSRLPVRRSDRPAGQARPEHAGGTGRAHGVRPGRVVRVLQRAVQPHPAQHALVVRQQLRRLSDRLPAPGEERLDGRRPPGRRDRAVQLRCRRRLHQVAQRPQGRAAAQRRVAGHRAHQRLGLPVGQRPRLGQRLRADPLVPLPVLRRHAHPRRALRPAQALRGLPHQQGPRTASSPSAWATGPPPRPRRRRRSPRPATIIATP